MVTTEVLSIVTGISTFLGIVGLFAYLYFTLLIRKSERSVQNLIEGDALFNAEQVLQILQQFTTDDARLEALKELTKYGTQKTSDFLLKVKDNVDIGRLHRIAVGHYKYVAGIAAIFFIFLASIAFIYYYSRPGSPSRPGIYTTQPIKKNERLVSGMLEKRGTISDDPDLWPTTFEQVNGLCAVFNLQQGMRLSSTNTGLCGG